MIEENNNKNVTFKMICMNYCSRLLKFLTQVVLKPVLIVGSTLIRDKNIFKIECFDCFVSFVLNFLFYAKYSNNR